MGQLDDIESDLTPLKKSAKFEIGFYDHFIGLGESFIIINHHKPSWPGPTRPDPTVRLFDELFHEYIEDRDVKFVHKIHSSLQFVLLIFGINIFDSYEIVRFSAT